MPSTLLSVAYFYTMEYTICMAKTSGLQFYKKEQKINKDLFRSIIEMIAGTFICVFLAFVITYVFGARTGIIGDSMSPELEASNQVLINRFVYMVSAPKRGDVIVFLPNGNTNTHYYIKRVVALPGETVQIIDGRLYVDGYVAEADDLYDRVEDAGMAETPVKLGNDEYFVLGDNRNSSEDSRSGNIGPVEKNTIIGKVWIVLPNGEDKMHLVR